MIIYLPPKGRDDMTELKYWENPYIIKENKEDGHNTAPA